jgi:hypothetical protein
MPSRDRKLLASGLPDPRAGLKRGVNLALTSRFRQPIRGNGAVK